MQSLKGVETLGRSKDGLLATASNSLPLNYSTELRKDLESQKSPSHILKMVCLLSTLYQPWLIQNETRGSEHAKSEYQVQVGMAG